MFGCHKKDMFTERLPLDEVIALCVANYPGTATYFAINGGWTTADHLLATLVEQDAGLVRIESRAERPGVTKARKEGPVQLGAKDSQRISFDAMPLDQFAKKYPARHRKD